MTIFFNTGTKMEFYKDGDICEVVGNRKVRNRYLILYRSTKTGKNFSDTRELLLECINNGTLTLQ